MCNGHWTSYWSLTQSQPDMTTADESVDNKNHQLVTSKQKTEVMGTKLNKGAANTCSCSSSLLLLLLSNLFVDHNSKQ